LIGGGPFQTDRDVDSRPASGAHPGSLRRFNGPKSVLPGLNTTLVSPLDEDERARRWSAGDAVGDGRARDEQRKTMQRRKFLIGVGSFAAAGAAAIGTGAVSTTQATRSVSVKTTGDASAELGLEGINSEYVTDDGVDGELAISIESLNPDGVSGINQLFRIKNNADHSLEVWGEPRGPHPDRVVFPYNGFDNDSYASLRQDDPPSVSAEILKTDLDRNGGATEANQGTDDGATQYNNGRVPEASGGRVEFGSGEKRTVAMIVDTRGLGVDETIIDSLRIFADDL
jgi:hypothetical protein